MLNIGVLALQGAVSEHIEAIERLGHVGVEVKTTESLKGIDGLILPGGESTTMRRLMDRYGFTEKLRNEDLPMFGTCAGLILLASEIKGEEDSHLNKLNIKVERNSFGRQVASFEEDLEIKGIEDPVNAVFIRAPHIESAGSDVEILGRAQNKIIAVKSGNYLGTSFHPELTDSDQLHELFIKIIKEAK